MPLVYVFCTVEEFQYICVSMKTGLCRESANVLNVYQFQT